MRAATHGCNEGSIEAGWLGQSHLPVVLNYVPTKAPWLMPLLRMLRRATAVESRANLPYFAGR